MPWPTRRRMCPRGDTRYGARCGARGAVGHVVEALQPVYAGLMDEARDVLKLRVELRRPGAQHRQSKEAHLRGVRGKEG